MAIKNDKTETPMINPTASRININEVLATQPLSVEQKAGFKAYMGDVKYMYQEEWDSKLQEYLNR